MNTKKIFLLLLFILIISMGLNSVDAHKNEKTGYVTKVIDGDTIKVSGISRNIRLWGVDTPELKTAKGKSVKKVVEKKLLGKKVTLDVDNKKRTDKYGRVLAKVYLKGKDINKWLLTKKYARVMYIPPSEFNKYSGGLTKLQFDKFTKNTGTTIQKSGTSSNSGSVYIATYSGTKYHFNKNCRGLSNSRSTTKISLSTAKSRGYTLCGWER
ncbi:MAG: thermonuclease family protein [Methanobrevibacter sp.]|nr:thermonuclease family protein [Methanobrevibacter sp.]